MSERKFDVIEQDAFAGLIINMDKDQDDSDFSNALVDDDGDDHMISITIAW